MTQELQDILVTIDTREQNQRRIKAVEDWATGHGAAMEHSKLDLCDYRLVGEFRGVPISVGIEAKGLNDFAMSYMDLPDKLARAYKLYDCVALFVEAGNYVFNQDPLKSDNFHMVIDNPGVRDGSADVLPLAVYENLLGSLQCGGVYVRQLRSEAHFPYAIAGVLINIVKPIHTRLEIVDRGWQERELNRRARFKGFGYKRAMKSLKSHPNLFWLCNASEDSLKECYGSKLGASLYAEIHEHSLETEAWRNGHHIDGTPSLMCDHMRKPCDQVNAYQCIKSTCVHHPDNFSKQTKNSVLQGQPRDNEGRLAFDAPAENPVTVGHSSPCGIIPAHKGAPGEGDTSSHPLKEPILRNHILPETKSFSGDTSSHPPRSLSSPTPKVSPRPGGDTLQSHPPAETILNYHNPHFTPAGGDTSNQKKHCTNETVKDLDNCQREIIRGCEGCKSYQVIDCSHPGELLSQSLGSDPHPAPPGAAVEAGLILPASPLLDDSDGEHTYTITCRHCHQPIEQDDESGFCQDVECVKDRAKAVNKRNLVDNLRLFLRTPHTVPEIVSVYGCSVGYAFDTCMGGVKSGILKKVTNPVTKETRFQRV